MTGDRQFGIVITAQARHGDLFDAARRLGSNAALARELGVAAVAVGEWINLKGCPAADGRLRARLEGQLLEITGKTWEELWPAELRAAVQKGEIGKRLLLRKQVACEHLLANFRERNLLPPPDEAVGQAEHRERVSELVRDSLRVLPPRQRLVVEMRRGLGPDGRCHTFEEVGRVLGLSKERVRQIELTALRKLAERRHTLFGAILDD